MAELDAKYRAQWSGFEFANTGDSATYLNDTERKIIYYLNLVRVNPQLFASTYAAGYKGARGISNSDDFDVNEASLITQLTILPTRPLLSPSKNLYDAAQCQAISVGEKGLTGIDAHDRSLSGCTALSNYAENIDFGHSNALDIVMSWLNDAGNVLGSSQLGHRQNCLDSTIQIIGVSVEPHKTYDKCTVMDATPQ